MVLAEKSLDDAKEALAKHEKSKGNKKWGIIGKNMYERILTNLQYQVNSTQEANDQAVYAYEHLFDGPDPVDLAIAEADLALAEERLLDAQSEYQRLIAGPDAADVGAVEASITAAQVALDSALIATPIDGTITAVEVNRGDRVEQGTVAFRLDDLTRMLVDVQVPEIDVNKIETGQPVSINFDAHPSEVYQGVVSEVARVGVETNGVVRFDIVVELLDADETIKPGMTAAINIQVGQVDEALLVPNQAVTVLEGAQVVYVLGEGGDLEAVEIETGVISDLFSEVLTGDLEIDDVIVLNPNMVEQ
jgi:HlyD family secretion protein